MLKNFLALVGLFVILCSPVIYIWCWKPNKSLKDGLTEWWHESDNDI